MDSFRVDKIERAQGRKSWIASPMKNQNTRTFGSQSKNLIRIVKTFFRPISV